MATSQLEIHTFEFYKNFLKYLILFKDLSKNDDFLQILKWRDGLMLFVMMEDQHCTVIVIGLPLLEMFISSRSSRYSAQYSQLFWLFSLAFVRRWVTNFHQRRPSHLPRSLVSSHFMIYSFVIPSYLLQCSLKF